MRAPRDRRDRVDLDRLDLQVQRDRPEVLDRLELRVLPVRRDPQVQGVRVRQVQSALRVLDRPALKVLRVPRALRAFQGDRLDLVAARVQLALRVQERQDLRDLQERQVRLALRDQQDRRAQVSLDLQDRQDPGDPLGLAVDRRAPPDLWDRQDRESAQLGLRAQQDPPAPRLRLQDRQVPRAPRDLEPRVPRGPSGPPVLVARRADRQELVARLGPRARSRRSRRLLYSQRRQSFREI